MGRGVRGKEVKQDFISIVRQESGIVRGIDRGKLKQFALRKVEGVGFLLAFD